MSINKLLAKYVWKGDKRLDVIEVTQYKKRKNEEAYKV
ncbi:hypothetical protein BSBH6_00106 [Bacillus subtilis]|nr:hypothetical protein BSBH6_00106 [Bacillus subtilis]RPK26470.1 hypothetical protein BH5_00105 [Bacillus subtilis]